MDGSQEEDPLSRKQSNLPTIGALALAFFLAGPAHGQGAAAEAEAKDNDRKEDAMPEEKRSPNRIDYIEIPAADIERAKKFYGEVFGWSFVDYGPDYASFNDGRLDGGLRKDSVGAGGGPLVIFYDAKLEDKILKIKKAGGKIVKEIFDFPGGRRFHFLDPDGSEFAIWSEE